MFVPVPVSYTHLDVYKRQMSNRWPLLVIAGSSSQSDIHKGGFQELDQVSLLSPFLKFTGKLTPDNIDMITQKALNYCIPVSYTHLDVYKRQY